MCVFEDLLHAGLSRSWTCTERLAPRALPELALLTQQGIVTTHPQYCTKVQLSPLPGYLITRFRVVSVTWAPAPRHEAPLCPQEHSYSHLIFTCKSVGLQGVCPSLHHKLFKKTVSTVHLHSRLCLGDFADLQSLWYLLFCFLRVFLSSYYGIYLHFLCYQWG